MWSYTSTSTYFIIVCCLNLETLSSYIYLAISCPLGLFIEPTKLFHQLDKTDIAFIVAALISCVHNVYIIFLYIRIKLFVLNLLCFCLQSVEVLQFVKRDLDEFSTAVKSEASNVVSSTTSALKDKLRVRLISCFPNQACSRVCRNWHGSNSKAKVMCRN